MPFYPGPGVGGHCIPLDPTYLAWQSRRDTGKPFRLVELAQDINAQMPEYVVRRIVDALGARGLPIKGAKLLALGVTYKPDVGDVRESAAIEVIAGLRDMGAKVSFHDPFVAAVDSHGLNLKRRALTEKAVAEADCVLLLTPHETYDLAWLLERCQVMFDARNAAGHLKSTKLVRL